MCYYTLMTRIYSKITSKKTLLLIAPALILIVGVAAIFAWNAISSDSETAAKPQDAPIVTSAFSFDPTKAAEWRQGPANESSMALFSNDRSCFTSIEYKTGTVDPIAESTKTQENLSKDGYIVEKLDSATVSIKVGSHDTQLNFRQFGIAGSGNAGQLYGGQAYGYTLLDKGYLHAQVNCNKSDQLPSAVSALTALSFKENN